MLRVAGFLLEFRSPSLNWWLEGRQAFVLLSPCVVVLVLYCHACCRLCQPLRPRTVDDARVDEPSNAVYRSFGDAYGLPNFVQHCNYADLSKLCTLLTSLPEQCYGIYYFDGQFYYYLVNREVLSTALSQLPVRLLTLWVDLITVLLKYSY